MPDPEIVNAVGGGYLQQEVDLQKLYENITAEEIRYDPEYWPGLYIRFFSDSPAVMVFRTGKYNIAGADSISDLITANRDFLSSTEELGLKVNDPGFEIRNIVCLDQYGRELNLESIAVKLGLESAEYEPEQFPGLLYNSPNTKGTFLVFRNGKIILTGSTDLLEASEAFDHLYSELDELFS